MGHCLVLDGVYTEDRATGRVGWNRSRRWATEDVEGLVVRIADRAEAWLARQGFGRAGDGGGDRGEEDALSVIQSASVAGRSAVGGGRRAKRVQVLLLHSAGPAVPAPAAVRELRRVLGSTETTEGEKATGDGGEAPFEASAGEVALARVE